jgi:CubicO group peptidase (beta-lactamase class C family)
MGGVAGHAGLFSCARDIDALLSALRESYLRVGGFVAQRVIREFWSRDGRVPQSTWCLGWDSPSPQGSSAGKYFSVQSLGHLGFTGCSVWLDLECKLHVILLTNRVHPRRDNERIREFRPLLHDLVREALG